MLQYLKNTYSLFLPVGNHLNRKRTLSCRSNTPPHPQKLPLMRRLTLLVFATQALRTHATGSWVSGSLNISECGWHLSQADCSTLLNLSCDWQGCNVAFNQTYQSAYNATVGSSQSGFHQELVPAGYSCTSWDPTKVNLTGYVKASSCGADYPAMITGLVLLGFLVAGGAIFAGVTLKEKCPTISLSTIKKKFLHHAKTEGSTNENKDFELA